MNRFTTSPINPWLRPLSWLYGLAVAARNAWFDRGWLPERSYPVASIGVGNLAVGGTGKTPHVEWLIRLLQNDYRVAVLSRGYKRKSRGTVEASPSCTAELLGDEPYQMYTKFPQVRFVVDEKRSRGMDYLLHGSEVPPQVVLLDDAFQHRYVKPGLQLLLTDYHRLFSDDVLLPAGRLRESVRGKERAQAVIVTKCPRNLKPIDFNIIGKKLDLFPCQRLFFSTLRYGSLRPLFPTEGRSGERSLLSLRKTPVVVLTGIASPQEMYEQLKRVASEVRLLAFADHHTFEEADFRRLTDLLDQMEASTIVVTTEKDGARLVHHAALPDALKERLYVLPVEIEFLQNKHEEFTHYIKEYVGENQRDRSVSTN